MRVSTLVTLAALGAAGYFIYTIAEQQNAERQETSNRRAEPVVMWFETLDQRNAYCEGAD
jgi:flagellar basal body-associated protein FliL